jgi:hypothetical protein
VFLLICSKNRRSAESISDTSVQVLCRYDVVQDVYWSARCQWFVANHVPLAASIAEVEYRTGYSIVEYLANRQVDHERS